MLDVLVIAPIDGPYASSNDEHESQPFDVELKAEYIIYSLMIVYFCLLFIVCG
jgi:hypothetical protein